jgi:hypothetical protein
MARFSQLTLITSAILMLAGCGSDANDKTALGKIDSRLGGKGDADPALTAALEDQIMVDPSLSSQANEHSIRPASEPNQAPIPVDRNASDTGAIDKAENTLGARAVDQAGNAHKALFTGCALDVQYSVDWANRLPADLPLYPQARVSEAGGSDNASCKLRAVTFASAAAPRALIDFYNSVGKKSGFSMIQKVEGTGTLISGARAGDKSAFYIIIEPNGSGSSADLVSNRGR